MEMLDDVKILDFTTNVAGPGASAIATDFGAQVIKIEAQSGDSARTYAPFIEGKGMTHAWVNRGKKSIVMNLKDPRAVEVCKKLAADADVLVEGFRPGVMDRLGLGYETMKEINPKLVYCSVSAFGQTGFDLLGQAISGMISVNGEKGGRPIKHGVTLADYFAGPNAYAAIMTALHYQRRTGLGQHIDVSLIQGMIYLNSPIDRLNDGVIVKPNGGHHSALCPFGGFWNEQGEGVIICAPNPKAWATLAKAMNRPDFLDPNSKYATCNTRAAHQEEIIPEIEAWLNTFPNMDAAIERMMACDVPCCKINNTEDVVNDPQVKHMGYIVQAPTQDDIQQETFLTRGPNALFSDKPGCIHKAPTLGQNTHEILASLGYSEDAIERMMADWAPNPDKI